MDWAYSVDMYGVLSYEPLRSHVQAIEKARADVEKARADEAAAKVSDDVLSRVVRGAARVRFV